MKIKQFERVLQILRDKAPDSVTKEELEVALKDSGVEFYRLPTYMWEIKNKAGVPVESIKDGKRVVAFRLADVAVQETEDCAVVVGDEETDAAVTA